MPVDCPLHDYACRFGQGALVVSHRPRAGDGFRHVFAGDDLAGCLRAAAARYSVERGEPPPAHAPPAAAADPAVSCVVVAHGNLHFVCELMIPALFAHAGNGGIEVIVVLNGETVEAPFPAHVRVVPGDGPSVARAYNRGAAHARAPLLALFHDDCLVDDPAWVDKVRAGVDAGAHALSPEIRRLEHAGGRAFEPLPVLKNVPLVIRRDVFDALGGYDETLQIGYEDLELTLRMMRAGRRIARVGFAYRHFGGMSSCLKYLGRPGMDLLFAALAVAPETIFAAFAGFARDRGRVASRLFAAMNALQLARVLGAHRDYLAGRGMPVDAVCDALLAQAAVDSGLSVDALHALPPWALDERVVHHAREGPPA